MRLTVGFLFALIAAPLAVEAADLDVPAAGELIRQLEDATSEEQKQTLELLKRHYGTTLDPDCQRQLLDTIMARQISKDGDISIEAIQIWAAAPDSWRNCQVRIESLMAEVANPHAPDEFRAEVALGLLLIGGARRDQPEIAELFFKLLQDRAESLKIRGFCASALLSGWLPLSPGTSDVLLKIMADRDEDPEFRASLFDWTCMLQSILLPESSEPLAKLMIAIGTSSDESVKIRITALAGYLTLMSHIRMNDVLVQMAALELLQQGLDFGWRWRTHLNSIVSEIHRSVAGQRSERSSGKIVQVAHAKSDGFIGDLFAEMPRMIHQIYIDRLCHPNGNMYGVCRESSGPLMVLLADKTADQKLREVAGDALQFSLAVDKKHVATLVKMLHSEEQFLHPVVAKILGKMGADAKPCLPSLIDIWKDDRESQAARAAAGEALRELAPALAARLGIVEDTPKP